MTNDSLDALQNIASVAKVAKNIKNGTQELPTDRAKAVEYGLVQFQQIGHERDQARRENAELRDKVAALQINSEGLTSQLSEAQSHLRSAMMIRDQALADRIKYEALFVSISAQMRAFAVPSEPLIKDHDAAD